MKRSLAFKLILCYIITLSLMFVGVNTVGSHFVKNYIKENHYSQLSIISANIIEGNVVSKYYNDEISYEQLDSYIHSISQAMSTTIWLLDADGNFVYDSSNQINISKKVNIDDIYKRFLYMNPHESIYIDGIINEPSIFNIQKIHNNNSTTNNEGSLILLMPDNIIDSQFSSIITLINEILVIISVVLAIIFLLIYFLTIAPVHKITKYAIEATQGQVKPKINIKSNDEYLDLANAIHFLTNELHNLDEYQRKFISNISHDFRSPLTSIKGYLEAMLDGTILPENYEKYIKIILFEAERLTGLTSNLLTLNNLDTAKQILEKTEFDINDIIKKTMAVYEGRCQKNKIELVTNFETETRNVYADQSKIQQVINNLLDNAIKFSPQNSKIIFTTYVKSDKVFISIKDHGKGIPKKSISHIWDRFYKIDASRGKDKRGTGLGLSITKEIINAHHENINVISTEGVGTEFSFTLPKEMKK